MQINDTPSVAFADIVSDLHASLLSSQQIAHAQMAAMQKIEREHRHESLAVLVEMTAS